MSHAGDTYDMGGGYYLYDTCGNDLLALGPDNKPIEDFEQAQQDVMAAAMEISADGMYLCPYGCYSFVSFRDKPESHAISCVKMLGKYAFNVQVLA